VQPDHGRRRHGKVLDGGRRVIGRHTTPCGITWQNTEDPAFLPDGLQKFNNRKTRHVVVIIFSPDNGLL
jgi:hypothetical protein